MLCFCIYIVTKKYASLTIEFYFQAVINIQNGEIIFTFASVFFLLKRLSIRVTLFVTEIETFANVILQSTRKIIQRIQNKSSCALQAVCQMCTDNVKDVKIIVS